MTIQEKTFITNLKKIPLGTLKLYFDNSYNKPIGDNLLKLKCIVDIIFGFDYNQPVDNLLPQIIKLIFGHDFNQTVNELPCSIKYLKFGYSFNHIVDNLPNSINKLIFGESFNKSVDNLPNSIKYLQFGALFSQSIDNLPEQLTHLIIDYTYDKSVNKLPNNLCCLKINNVNTYFDNFIENINGKKNSLYGPRGVEGCRGACGLRYEEDLYGECGIVIAEAMII